MSAPAIRVEGLSKRYRIGALEDRPDTLAGAFATALLRPLANLRRLRRLSRFDDDDGADVVWALREVSFEVAEGEVVGIIGRNGAGKTTLLKVLSRITAPTAGRVELHGRVASLLEVGTGFHPELTGRENVYLNGTILGMKKTEVDAKLAEIVDFSGIERFIDTPLKRYSSGMAVRLAFSVAAHLEPEILLIDEVLAVGDAEFRKRCLGKMQDVAEHGRTVLFVSHNMAAVNRLCERSLWLDDGRLLAVGPTSEVVGEYLSSGNPETGERSWPDDPTAPGSDAFRLLGIRTRSSGRTTASVDVRQPIGIEIDYRLIEEIYNLRVGFHLLSELGTIVLTSGDQEAANLDSATREPGLYRSVCRIPAHLLNSNRYSLTCVIDIPFVRLLLQLDNVLDFHVERTGKSEGLYPERSPGVIDPRLDWAVERRRGEVVSEGLGHPRSPGVR